MSSLPKFILNDTVIFVTTSIEEGLPLVAHSYMKLILESALARALQLYKVRICHFMIIGNHVHMILVVVNPEDVKNFMGRFKTESSHAINRLLGIRKKTWWCEGYDSPILLTRGDVVKEVVYTYINPVKDNLVESVDEYPGLSSWQMYNEGRQVQHCPRIRRFHIKPLESTIMTEEQQHEVAQELRNKAKERQEFVLEPNAWMDCFGITDPEERKEYNDLIRKQVREYEVARREERKKDSTTVLGRKRLIQQPMDKPYQSNRQGQRTWCICSDIVLRKIFIAWVKELVKRAREVYQRWLKFDFSEPYPPGLFPPSLPKNIEILTSTVRYW